MKKRFTFLFVALLAFVSLALLSGCGEKTQSQTENNAASAETENTSEAESKSNTDNTTTNSSNSSSTSKKSSSTQSSNTNITSDGNSIWTKEEHTAAEKFANELVVNLKNKDMAAISKKVAYPIELKVDGKDKTVNNEKEFKSISFDKVFTESLVNKVSSTTKMFSKDLGFMLGDGEIWFSPVDGSSEMKIIGINN